MQDEEDEEQAGDPNKQIAAKEADPEEKERKKKEKDAVIAKLRDFKARQTWWQMTRRGRWRMTR